MQDKSGDVSAILLGLILTGIVSIGSSSILGSMMHQGEAIEQLRSELAKAQDNASHCQAEFSGYKEGRR